MEDVDLEELDEAASNCSRADCGRMILSPFRSFDLYLDGLAMEKVAAQLNCGRSAMSRVSAVRTMWISCGCRRLIAKLSRRFYGFKEWVTGY